LAPLHQPATIIIIIIILPTEYPPQINQQMSNRTTAIDTELTLNSTGSGGKQIERRFNLYQQGYGGDPNL